MPIFPPQIENLAALPVSSLAYLGDAVYELHVRQFFLIPARKPSAYHKLVVERVRAESQAHELQLLIEADMLTVIERDLVRRGRNSAGNASRPIDPDIYQKATGLEVLLGYLYLSDGDRLQFILQHTDHETQA